MAHITDLPEEVIIMIARRTDFYSLRNMYNSCKLFRNILSMHGVVRQCQMTANLVATVNTLKSNFFKAISNHLVVLNMRGVHDLTKTKVLPTFKKLKHLKVLDISYTNLNIPDLMAIHSACPTLIDITIDYKFGPGSVEVTENTMQQWQSLFEHFKNVHFVCSLDDLLSNILTFHILKKSKLNMLQFSVINENNPHTTLVTPTLSECQPPNCSHFAVYLMVNWKKGRFEETPDHFTLVSKMLYEKYEFCVIYTLKWRGRMLFFYATPLFKEFFSKQFNINIQSTQDYEAEDKGNIALLAWNKETTRFDDIFFQKLYTRLKQYIPFYCNTLTDVICPKTYDWIFLKPTLSDLPVNSDTPPPEKKRLTSVYNVEFDYDNLLQDKDKVQLSIIYSPDFIISASLPPNGQYFRKITFLSLYGAMKYNTDFFLNLFEQCINLVTLSVELPSITSGRYAYDILNGMKRSQSLKNLRLVDKGMDFKHYFNSFSKCKTLENIILIDPKQWDHSNIADPSLFIESCTKLYSFYIEAPFSETASTKQLQLFNQVKIKFKRHHLRVAINRLSEKTSLYGYDPFVEVFKLNTIKPYLN